MAFRENTVFVIGAGASTEFGLPAGASLAKRIRAATIPRGGGRDYAPEKQYIWNWARQKYTSGVTQGQAATAIDAINNGIHTAVSIDAFMHRMRSMPTLPEIGKVLIAYEILKAEAESTLSASAWRQFHHNPYLEHGDNQSVNPEDTWLGDFTRIMFDGVDDAADVGRGLKIICFNYDRCIEHYLAHAIADGYRIPLQQAIAVVESNITIIHPYGTLGRITEYEQECEEDRIAYGFLMDGTFDISDVAGRIRTYSENLENEDALNRIHKAMKEAKVVVFLGFGFNNQNLNLLRVTGTYQSSLGPSQVYASAYSNHEQVHKTMVRRIGHLWDNDTEKNKTHWLSKTHIEFGASAKRLLDIHNVNLSSFSRKYVSGTDLVSLSSTGNEDDG